MGSSVAVLVSNPKYNQAFHPVAHKPLQKIFSTFCLLFCGCFLLFFYQQKFAIFLPLLINLLLLLKYKCAILEFLLCIIALETPEVSPLYLGEGATLKKSSNAAFSSGSHPSFDENSCSNIRTEKLEACNDLTIVHILQNVSSCALSKNFFLAS